MPREFPIVISGSATLKIRIPDPPPAAPSDLAVTGATETTIALSFTPNVVPPIRTAIERSADGLSGWAEVALLTPGASTYTDSPLTDSTSYYYRARNWEPNSGLYSDYSAIVQGTTLTPAAPNPPVLAATAVGAHQIDLAITIGAPGATATVIQRRVAGVGDFAALAEIAGNATAYPDYSVEDETSYDYRAQHRLGASQVSDWSNTATATTPAETIPSYPPAAPLAVTATAGAPDGAYRYGLVATLTPGAVDATHDAATGYIWEVSCDLGYHKKEVARTTTPSFSWEGVFPGSNPAIVGGGVLRLWGRAYNAAGISDATRCPTAILPPAYTPTSIPPTPSYLYAVAASDTILMAEWRWGDGSGRTDIEAVRVQWSTDGGATWPGEKLIDGGWYDTKITGLTASTTYTLRVRLENAVGSSASWSPTYTVATLGSGQVQSPTGRNCWGLAHPLWCSKWMTAAGMATTTTPRKRYDALKAKADACVASPGTATSQDPFLAAALMYRLTGTTAYANAAFENLMQYYWFQRGATVLGVWTTVVDDPANTASSFKLAATGLLTGTFSGSNAVIWDRGGVNRDPTRKMSVVRTYNSTTGVVTLDAALPQTPAPGDPFGMMQGNGQKTPVSFNEIREWGIFWALLADWVWDGLTSDQQRDALDILNGYYDRCQARLDAAGTLIQYQRPLGNSNGDVDQTAGQWYGTVLWDLLSHQSPINNPRPVNDWIDFPGRSTPNLCGPWGGLDLEATPTDGPTLSDFRQVLYFWALKARGGEWLGNATEYKPVEGELVSCGQYALRHILDREAFPEWRGFWKDFALRFTHDTCGAMETLKQWDYGDDTWRRGPNPANVHQSYNVFSGVIGGDLDYAPALRRFSEYTFEGNVLGGAIPYAPRYWMLLDPFAPTAEFTTLPNEVITGDGTRTLVKRTGWADANEACAVIYGGPQIKINHRIAVSAPWEVWRKGEYVFTRPGTYGDFYSPNPDIYNAAMIAGNIPAKDCQGCIAAETGDDYAYLVGQAHGRGFDTFGLSSFAYKAALGHHEQTRTVLVLMESKTDPVVVVTYDRLAAHNFRKQPMGNTYGYPHNLNGAPIPFDTATDCNVYRFADNLAWVVQASPPPTTTSVTINSQAAPQPTNWNDWLAVFKPGGAVPNNVPDGHRIRGYSTGAGTVTLDFTGNPLPVAPNPGDKLYVMGPLSPYGSFEMRWKEIEDAYRNVGKMFLWHLHAYKAVGGTINVDDPAIAHWTTPGGQICKHQILTPTSGVTRTVLDSATFFSATQYPKKAVAGTEQMPDFKCIRLTCGDWPVDATTLRRSHLLNVMSAADDLAHVTASLIQSANVFDAALIHRNGLADALVALSARPDDRTHRSGFTLPWAQGVSACDVYLGDLDPTRTWTYSLDGGGSQSLTVPRSGLGRLTVNGAGSHSLVLSS